MRGAVPTSIPDRNLVTELAEGEATCERLLAYAPGLKHLAQKLIDLISGVLNKDWLALLGRPAHPRAFATVSSSDQSRTY